MIIALKRILIYTYRLCTKCTKCNLDQEFIKLLNERTNNYWFCPTCAKPAFNAVFLDTDIVERCKIFLNSIEARISNLESEQFSTKNTDKIFEDTVEQNNSAVTHCMETLDSLNKRVDTLEKIPNESSNTQPIHTIKVNTKETSNTNQKQDKSVLMNQLQD